MNDTPARPLGPDPADVRKLTELLDLLEGFIGNEQRARYLLSCNWMRDRDALVTARAYAEMAGWAAEQAVTATTPCRAIGVAS